MNFFDGIDTTATSFESSNNLTPIPDDTRVLAIAEEAKNASYENDTYINIKWRVQQPAEFANRVLFQKVKVYDSNSETATKNKKMLAAIATNSGGKLFAAMQAANESQPSDSSLSKITNAPMVLLLGVWELDDKSKNGNWVKAISARQIATNTAKPVVTVAPVAHVVQEKPFVDPFDINEYIPF